MAVPVPNLDNRTFEQLLEEARKSIPNYAPGWTNHNPADPGITLIELFAWLAEITSYRTNLVTEEHRLKYLKLLGIRPRGTLPAITDLSFEADEAEKPIPLEKGRGFLAEKDGEKIDFELLENIAVVPFRLEKIIVTGTTTISVPESSLTSQQIFIDRTVSHLKKDLFFTPSGLDTKKKSDLYLGFSLKNKANVPKSLNFMCYLYEKDLPEPGKHGEEAEYEFKNAKLKWEISVQRDPKCPEKEKWKEVPPDEDRTQNFRKSGRLLFTGLGGWACSTIKACPSQGKEKENNYFWLRCTVLESEYEYPPRIETISLNTATVAQKKKVTNRSEKSSGLPGQVFKLPETPVLRESLKLTVAEEWKKVGDFDGSGSESTHFTLDSRTGEIRFGDGLQGRVPPEGAKIEVEYETERGEQKVPKKSSGLPGQVFKLPETPVLKKSLKLTVAEEWNEVEDFDGSGPESTHFTLDSRTGEIKFGDGLRGRVPRKDAEILAREYETGRGKQGNLPVGSRWELKGGKIEGLTINNLKPAAGGKGEEDITEAVNRFIRDLKVPYRAVTSEDFEYIARETPGLRVAQAKAVPNFDPADLEGGEGSVTVVVIPFSPLETFNTPPEPSRGFREAVARHLEKHRLLGTRVHVVSPEYVRVEVKASIGLVRGFFEGEVRTAVLAKLNLFLHPAKGGSSGKGWPVGKPVYRSELYRLIMETEGVYSVQKISIHAGKGAKLDENGDLVLASKTATVYSGVHSVEIAWKSR